MPNLSSETLDQNTIRFSGLLKVEDGFAYRDLNKNGRLDVYEDPRQPIEVRVEDLLGQMTLEEKAGAMFIQGSLVNEDGSIKERDNSEDGNSVASSLIASAFIKHKKMNHFNLWGVPSIQAVALWHNSLQQFAEQSRLGIPVTIATDPRHQFSHSVFELAANEFTQFCNPIGFGAIADPEAIREFIHVVRQEYLALGMRMALHPQIDLATEPRWPRINGTFGEDAHLTALLTTAYIEGLQGDELGPDSIACMAKHFPGGGPENEGLDPHFDFQKGQVYPGNNFDYHLIPFEAAFAANTAAIMPSYGVPVDQTDENVAMSFNKAIITGLLREKYAYDGVVCTDWGLINETNVGGKDWPARAWGVEYLTPLERTLKIIDAGVDQFGGEHCPELVIELVRKGLVPESRLDESVRRLLRMKFQLGLFDNPFIDPDRLPEVFGKASSLAAGERAQKRAMTLLKNEGNILPLQGNQKIYVKNIDANVAARYAEIVDTPQEADFAILHLDTPWYPVEGSSSIASDFHHGDLDFKGEIKAEILALLHTIPTIVVIYADRPPVIPDINAAAQALIMEYGASDKSILDVLFGTARPEGKLPFELPSSMQAVYDQKPDVPYDSQDPLYPFGYGLSYV